MARTYVRKKALESLDVEAAIRDGLGCVRAFLKDPEADGAEKARIGAQLVCKYMPNKLTGDMKMIMMDFIRKDGTEVKADVGS